MILFDFIDNVLLGFILFAGFIFYETQDIGASLFVGILGGFFGLLCPVIIDLSLRIESGEKG